MSRDKAFDKFHRSRRHLDRNDARLVWDAAMWAAEPSYWNSHRKMIERVIVGLRDGWATRKDADDALAVLVPGRVVQAEQPAPEEVSQADVPGAHHLTMENVAAVIRDLRAIAEGKESILLAGRDWRTSFGVIAKIMEWLASTAASAPTNQLIENIDTLASTAAASLPDVVMPEPVAWRYQRDTQANPGVPDGKWRLMEHGKQALELQGKRGFTANTSFHCWEPLFAAQPAEGSAQVTLQARSPDGDPWQEVVAADFFKAHANGYEVSACVHSLGKNSIRLKVAAPERSDTPEPIYFVRYSGAPGGWREASEEAYHLFSEGNRRILFATPTAASKALDAAAPAELVHQVELDPEQGTWLDVKESEVPTWQRKKFIVRTLARIDGDKQGAQSDIESFNRSLRSPAI